MAYGDTIRSASFFSGVGGMDLGFERAGIRVVSFCERDHAALGVLRNHWPDPSHTYIEDITSEDALDRVPDADVWGGGFPCQDLSTAGRRSGLAGAKSGLWYAWHRLLRERRPPWVVIENVTGLLSSDGGRDFAIVLGGLTGRLPGLPAGGWQNAGFTYGSPGWYSVAWRVLDAQYFGVAQQRRRVFLVASLGDGRAGQVLFERRRDPAGASAHGDSGKDATGAAGIGDGSPGQDRYGGIYEPPGVPTGYVINAHGHGVRRAKVARTLTRAGSYVGNPGGTVILDRYGIRRLTPVECERVQGFPDNWTLCSGGAEQRDSVRYQQMGNAIAVPVAEWIGRRIAMIHSATGGGDHGIW